MTQDSRVAYLERVIRHMTGKVSGAGGGKAPPEPPGWWVLVCGEVFDPDSLPQRDQARDRLRLHVAKAGFVLAVHEWVWDATNQAQLVVGRFERQDQADLRAEELRHRGFQVRVIPEVLE